VYKNLKYIASLNKKATQRVIAWEIFHSTLLAIPSGVLLVVVWELFSEQPNTQTVWTVVALMTITVILQLFVASGAMVRSNSWVYDLSTQLRIRLGNRIQRFSLGFFKTRDPGEIAGVVLQDVANFEGIFGHSVGNILSAMFTTTVLSIFLLFYDWRLALCLLIAIPLVYPFLKLGNHLISKYGKKQIVARSKVEAKILEYIQGIRHLKSYQQIGKNNKVLEESLNELRRQSIKMESIPGPFLVVAFIVFELCFIGMLALGLYYFSNNSITIPVLITFLILGYNLYNPLKVVLVDYSSLRYMNESLDRIVSVMNEPVMEGKEDLFPEKYDISFENVSFSYGDKPAVTDLNFNVPEKSMLALVGHSGSGKTTIASLIARFWDIDSGSIKFGGVDIRHIDPDKFYTLLSEVFQDVYLFDDTIYNNIKIGKPTANREEIQKVAEKAQVLAFANELPQGLDTKVGEGGSKLSGGEKQRISIARALLKDAPIVLLDEATASLDPENEIYIQQAIQELIRSKTVIVIAHKLATIQRADQILVLDQGKIAERGTHEELLAKNKIYHNMWTLQQKSGGWEIIKNKKSNKTKAI